jgi:hypothetical protein
VPSSWITSPIIFGGYTFPYGMRLSSREQDSRVDQTDIPFTAGINAPAGITGVRTIDLTGIIGGYGAVDSLGQYISNRDQLEAELQLMASWLESGYQKLTIGFADARYCYAQKTKLKVAYQEAENGIIAHVDIEMIAADPRWFATATQNSPTYTYGGSGSNLVSAGSGLVFPVITITTPGVTPSVKIHPGGGSAAPYVKVALPGYTTPAGGDIIIINCDPNPAVRPNAVLLNGAPALYLLGTTGLTNTMGNQAFFPYMQPGSNWSYADPGNPGGSAVITWSDTWIF